VSRPRDDLAAGTPGDARYRAPRVALDTYSVNYKQVGIIYPDYAEISVTVDRGLGKSWLQRSLAR
jgi:hypothetical protein